jgi:hypothetical protein
VVTNSTTGRVHAGSSFVGTKHWPVGSGKVGGRFSRRRYVLSAGGFEKLRRLLCPFRIVAMNRQQNAAVLDAAFIALRLVLRNAETDKRFYDASNRSAESGASKSTCNKNLIASPGLIRY